MGGGNKADRREPSRNPLTAAPGRNLGKTKQGLRVTSLAASKGCNDNTRPLRTRT